MACFKMWVQLGVEVIDFGMGRAYFIIPLQWMKQLYKTYSRQKLVCVIREIRGS